MITTIAGVWNARVFTIIFLVIFLEVLILSRVMFNRSHKKGLQQDPFLCGNTLPQDMHLWASNLYWGFTRALKRYYGKMIPEHTGNINDYVAWFTVVTALIMVILGVTA